MYIKNILIKTKISQRQKYSCITDLYFKNYNNKVDK